MNIAIVDDHKIFVQGLSSLFAKNRKIKVLMKCYNGLELIESLKQSDTLPDIVVLDIEMPVMNGLETLKILKKKYPKIKVLILTMHNDEVFLSELITRGVNGFLLKDSEVDQIEEALLTIYEKDFFLTDKLLYLMRQKMSTNWLRARPNNKFTPLSKRELEVMKLICEERITKEISELLSISTRTVEGHRANIIAKTGAKNVVGLVMYAVKHGIVTP